jgi:ABC-2 type transport system ATP-binding protein
MTASTTAPAIAITGLSKRYGAKTALTDLNLHIAQGEIFGYLGPNGAGKTTTIRILLDLIRPSAGRAHVLGRDVHADSVAVRAHVGYLPGDLALWDGARARDVIAHFARLRGGTDARYTASLRERLQFDDTRRVREYSTGNRRKLGLILALMHKPALLILDEPTSGLDPLVQQTFHQLMHEVKAEGRTVFLSSHVLSEVQAVCDRVGILRGGVLQRVQAMHDLMETEQRRVVVRLREAAPTHLLDGLNTSQVQAEANTLRFGYTGPIDPLLRALAPYYVEDLRISEPSLESIFIGFYQNEDAAAGEVRA